MIAIKTKALLIACSCILFLISGCTQQVITIGNNEIASLFWKSESYFSAVATEFYPLGLEAAFYLEDSVVVSQAGDGRNIEVSGQVTDVVFNCLQLMNDFLIDNYDTDSYWARINTQTLDEHSFFLFFEFWDNKNAVASGIAYTTDVYDGNFYELRPNWYFYAFPGI